MRTLIGVAVFSLVSGAAFGVAAVKKGDVNGDGRIDKADAQLVMRMMLHSGSVSPSMKAAADVNGDGVVDIRDARILLKKKAS